MKNPSGALISKIIPEGPASKSEAAHANYGNPSGNASEYWKAAKAAVSSLIKSMLELKEGGVKIKDEKIEEMTKEIILLQKKREKKNIDMSDDWVITTGDSLSFARRN